MHNIPKKIPRKNYFKATLIVSLTLLISLAICVSYNKYLDYLETVPLIRGYVPELEPKNLDDYVVENEDFYLYVCKAPDEDCEYIEKSLINMIEKKGLEFVYLNISDAKENEFYNDFNEKYADNNKLYSCPAFIIFKDGKVKDLVQKNYRNITEYEIKYLIEKEETTEENND